MDLVILNLAHVTRTTPELTPPSPNFYTTPTGGCLSLEEENYGEFKYINISRAVGSLVVRASDSRPEGLGSMLDVTKYPPSAHGVRAR
ncbi:hypothetical protein TNCV_3530571 [Trichonephila clavipes]|nr:hypothetical protein TNCV_3530571 [Trichonephila clavipes]